MPVIDFAVTEIPIFIHIPESTCYFMDTEKKHKIYLHEKANNVFKPNHISQDMWYSHILCSFM